VNLQYTDFAVPQDGLSVQGQVADNILENSQVYLGDNALSLALLEDLNAIVTSNREDTKYRRGGKHNNPHVLFGEPNSLKTPGLV
jgi:hypothetical protein